MLPGRCERLGLVLCWIPFDATRKTCTHVSGLPYGGLCVITQSGLQLEYVWYVTDEALASLMTSNDKNHAEVVGVVYQVILVGQ